MKLAIVEGHGQYSTYYDPGATNGKYQETVLARNILLELGKLIAPKIPYVHCKTNFDTKLITEEAITKGCDYMICLHHNSSSNKLASYTEGYWWNDQSIPWTKDLVNNLATMFGPVGYNKKRDAVQGVRWRKDFAANTIPNYAFLELGFVSNDKDAHALDVNRVEIAKLMVKSIERFSGVKILGANKQTVILSAEGPDRSYAIVDGNRVQMPFNLIPVNGVYLAELRFLCAIYGCAALYDIYTKEITIKGAKNDIRLYTQGPKKQYITVNGEDIKMPYTLVPINERNLIHVASLTRALEIDTIWDQEKKQIRLIREVS